jgi:acyl-CoA synthetase (AMP-forming)/AMP-acid ligase II
VRLKLPVYMLPRRFEHQDLMPLNANGKIDRLRLEEHLLG